MAEAEQPSMEEVIKQQKAQCPFCKIVAGEIPSIKVHEDDLVLAIMDINPATKGHILLMPKEHYPIMPLIPRETFEHMFTIAKYLMRAQQEALHVKKSSIFIANGGIAGQQSAHFMVHILPREEGDKLGFLDAIGDNTETGEDIKQLLQTHIPSSLQRFAAENPSLQQFLGTETASENVSTPQAPTSTATNEQKDHISQLYESNPEFKELILNHPDKLKEMITADTKLSALFSGIDIDALSAKLKEMEAKRQ